MVGPAQAGDVPHSMLVLDESAGAAAGPFYAAIVASLRAAVNRDPARQASIFVEHLDLSRFRGEDYERGLKAYLHTKYGENPVGVVVAIGDGALRYVLRSRAELWPTVPVVFTFVDPSSASSLNLPPDVTGITYRLRFADMVTAARAVEPDLNEVVVVGDAFDKIIPYRHFKDELPEIAATGLRITDLTGLPIRDVRKRVTDLPKGTAIIYTAMYSDGEGTFLAPVEALRLFADKANRPIIVTTDTQIGAGGAGGLIVASAALGQEAGSLVLRIFNGESPSAIPISEGKVVKPVFDWRQLQRWNVNDSNLPPGSEIRFKQLGAWDQYRWQIVAIALAVMLQAALIHWLLLERRRRHRSEVLARNTMAELTEMNRMATGSELSASIAHEVMQPLTGMVASANAGLRWLGSATPDLDKTRAMLDQIVSAGHRTAEVVRAIRAVFKKDVANNQPVRMNDLIVEVLNLIGTELAQHDIAVEEHLDENLPVITGDPIQLQQVVLNLIMNAVDAMEAADNADRILGVRTEIVEGGIQVGVEDNGPGVDPDKLSQIFKPLFTTKTQGMGLGLAICRSITEAHHGKIRAFPRKPHGLSVQFYLPVKQPRMS